MYSIWLHDFARTVPLSVELHGFDISLDQIGANFWLPENMHMHSWNLFQSPDEKFIGYFDVVHVRLITLIVENNDPRPLLENLTKLLKPGGYLQWDEVDTVNCYIKTVPGVLGSNLEELFSQIRGHDTWKTHLVKIMTENRYENPQRYSYLYEDNISRIWTDEYVATWKEYAFDTLKASDELLELERKAMEEVRRGASICTPKLVWVARKAQP